MTTGVDVRQLAPTLYEDDEILAVEKPSGIDASTVRERSAPGLAEIIATARGADEHLLPVNRLTRYESGVLLLAKNTAVHEFLRKGLNAQRVDQSYIAVVMGRMNRAKLTIQPGHGTSRGRSARREKDAPGRNRSKTGKPVADRAPSGRGVDDRPTQVETIKPGERRTLVRCSTSAPNTHVLRAQLRAADLRLLGDNVHQSTPQARSQSLTCLHLARIVFHHPTLKRKIIVSCRPPRSFERVLAGEWDCERPLQAALVRRLSLLADANTDAYRLLTGNVEDVPGLVAEKFGDVVILQILEERPGLAKSLTQIARWYRETLGTQAVYVKRFVKQRSEADPAVLAELHDAMPLLGRRVPEEIEIRERGLRFAIRPYDGFSVGLFLDHRDNRQHVRAQAAGKRVLNLFAYTCGFSVAAASGGAQETVSVDVSPKHLDWGRTNFELNTIDPANHPFIRSDALDYLKRAQRQGRQFDMIILDPPTFAHARTSKRGFSITRDLSELIAGAVALLTPGGTIMVATNNRRLSVQDLRDRIKAGTGQRRYRIRATPDLPTDFAMDPHHAKTLFAEVS